jgi:hypothetical protein
MTGKTHASCGILVGALAIEYYKTDLFTSVTIVVLAVIASLLPDICHTQSKIGRRDENSEFFYSITFWSSNLYTFNFIYSYNRIRSLCNTDTTILFYDDNYWVDFTCYTRYVNA